MFVRPLAVLSLILLTTTIARAQTLAERWRQAVEEMCLLSPDGREMSVTISIGIAAYQWRMESADQLVESADVALYRAKQGGRNCIEVEVGEP